MGSRQEQQRHSSYKIYVKMMKTVPLDVEYTDTVDQVKAKIGAIEGIDKGQQELFFAGIHLKNDNVITDYGIMANSYVDLYVTDGIQISVKIPSVGKTIKLDVKKSQSVADIKADIEQKGGIPRNEQILMHAGRQLEDTQFGLGNGQTLHVLICPTEKLHISVNVEGERTLNLDVKSWYTIADVKLMIETMLGLPAFMQTQSGGGAELEDTQILKSLHVENGEVLMLYQSVQLFIKTWEGKTLTKDAMKKIEEKLPLKEGVYYLHYRGRALPPGDTLRKSKIGSNSTIEVRLQNVEEYCKTERSAGELASWARRLN
ncbi:polyubiquitin-like [Panicum miliaceum]|uniref:Polyubiquitin-like n=1 Tax=Panicum miliaceum TaxID=4540 RepID=A0A3L6SD44_PANMI|nr:polyubiquitin-like [Panicum miliaceum]